MPANPGSFRGGAARYGWMNIREGDTDKDVFAIIKECILGIEHQKLKHTGDKDKTELMNTQTKIIIDQDHMTNILTDIELQDLKTLKINS